MSTPHPADEATLRVSADPTPRAPVNLAQFAPGTLIAGRYRIASLLGSGGMGEVYRADDTKLDQVVALKFLPAALARDPVLLARLHDEVRLGRQVSHPNVCRIYDIGEFGDAHFVAMEYVDGEDLARLLRRIGRLSHDKGVELAHGIAAGLAAAHAKGILHRDLKPANVMIDGHGNPRITDFGLALDFEDSGFADAAGTPAYMAPEQLEGRPASVQSDLYALGLVMVEMFTGRRHSADAQPTPSQVLDPAVDQVVQRCLARDPAQRPRSARDVLEALPGGDPLAAALAAGETPSPRMVAAAGAEGSLKRGAAWTWLGASAVMMAVLLAVNGDWNLIKRIPFDLPPAVLEQRATEAAAALGLPHAAYQSSSMFADERYLAWVTEHDQSPRRFDDLHHGPPAVLFRVRLSSQPLTPLSDSPLAGAEDPPLKHAGDAVILLDTGGRLTGLTAIPPKDAAGKADWNRLLAMAGLDPSALRRVDPSEVPPHFADERAAWEGTWPGAGSRPLRIEAAAAGGVPVLLHLTGPWDTSDSEERMPFSGQTLYSAFFAVAAAGVLLGSLLAWRNIRLRRGDRAGAFRLAVAGFVVSATSDLLVADYAGGLDHQMHLLLTVLRGGVLVAALVYVAYIALEPFIRRRWPDRLIGWSRLLAGNFRDPMVGRDILIAVTAGIAHALIAALSNWLPGRMGWSLPRVPETSRFFELLGVRYTLAALIGAALSSLFFGFLMVLVLIGLTILLRRRTPAVIGLFLIQMFVYAIASQGNPSILAACTLLAVIWTAVTVRVGLLGIAMAQFIFITLLGMQTAIAPHSWAALPLVLPLVMVAAIALYAFRTALGGQPVFSGALD